MWNFVNLLTEVSLQTAGKMYGIWKGSQLNYIVSTLKKDVNFQCFLNLHNSRYLQASTSLCQDVTLDRLAVLQFHWTASLL